MPLKLSGPFANDELSGVKVYVSKIAGIFAFFIILVETVILDKLTVFSILFVIFLSSIGLISLFVPLYYFHKQSNKLKNDKIKGIILLINSFNGGFTNGNVDSIVAVAGLIEYYNLVKKSRSWLEGMWIYIIVAIAGIFNIVGLLKVLLDFYNDNSVGVFFIQVLNELKVFIV